MARRIAADTERELDGLGCRDTLPAPAVSWYDADPSYGAEHWPCSECEALVSCEACDDEVLLEPLLDFLCWWYGMTDLPFDAVLYQWLGDVGLSTHGRHWCDACDAAMVLADYEMAWAKEEP